MFGLGKFLGGGGTGMTPGRSSTPGSSVGSMIRQNPPMDAGASIGPPSGLFDTLMSRAGQDSSMPGKSAPVDMTTPGTPLDPNSDTARRIRGGMTGQQSPGNTGGMIGGAIGSMMGQPPPNVATRTPPAWQRWATGQKMQDAVRNNWMPNPMAIRLMDGNAPPSLPSGRDLLPAGRQPSGWGTSGSSPQSPEFWARLGRPMPSHSGGYQQPGLDEAIGRPDLPSFLRSTNK